MDSAACKKDPHVNEADGFRKQLINHILPVRSHKVNTDHHVL